MARNPNYQVVLTYADQSGERSTTSINTALAADVGSGVPPLVAALISAFRAELTQDQDPVQISATAVRRLSTAQFGSGNREDKLELRYVDNTTYKVYTMEVPCRADGLAVSPGSDLLPADTWTATKSAFEAIVRSPDGNAVTLQSVRIIGRNV